VLLDANGRPIVGSFIEFDDDSGDNTVETDSSGRFATTVDLGLYGIEIDELRVAEWPRIYGLQTADGLRLRIVEKEQMSPGR
jgi:hypothetical protein